MLNAVQAPTGSRCLYCGCDVSGSYVRKCIYVPDPVPWRPDKIKFAGFGWSCNACYLTGGKNQIQNKREDKNMEITVKIEAPELASAIRTLAEAIGGQVKNIPGPIPTTPITAEFTAPMAQPVTAPVTPAPMTPTAPAMPLAPPATPAMPLVQPPVPGPAAGTVPTTAQTYTMEQLAVAATQLVDAGRRGELVNLLAAFGVQALTALPKEQYGNFATQLRAMGARI